MEERWDNLAEIYSALDVKLSGMRASIISAKEECDERTQEVDMLADENKKMAEYLLYQHECNRIDLNKDGLGWLIVD